MTIPTFGERITDKHYQSRYGVYAILPRKANSEIVLVQAPNGAWFLPGGEIEIGESHAQALDRELHEELGIKAHQPHYIGQADEYFYSSHRDVYYHNPAYLYTTSDFNTISKPLEDFNTIKWFTIDDALLHLKRGSHRWGVYQWQKSLSEHKAD